MAFWMCTREVQDLESSIRGLKSIGDLARVAGGSRGGRLHTASSRAAHPTYGCDGRPRQSGSAPRPFDDDDADDDGDEGDGDGDGHSDGGQ